jgi:hypothetical protein
MNGILGGGWNFVWAAYIISAAILGSYTFATIRKAAR